MSVRKRGGTLKVLSLADLLAYPFEAREHLLMPWLRQGESVLVWAGSGIGKTMLTLTMALAIAGGGEVLGWRNATPRRVLILDGEMHAEDLKDRLAMLMPAVAGIDTAAAAGNLALIPRQLQDGRVTFPDIASAEGQEAVLAEIRKHRAELVILDNFSTLAEVADENEASAMSPVLSFLLRLKQEKVAAILVHHSGKSGKTFRGSSKLATTFEVILGLTAHEGAAAGDGAAFNTEWTKYRGAPNASVRPALVILKDRGEGGGVEWTSRASEDDDVALMVAEAQTLKHTLAKDLAAALDWTASKLSQVKRAALNKGRIVEGELEGYFADAGTERLENPGF